MRITALTAVVVTTAFIAALFGGCDCYALERDPNAEAEERLRDELMRRYAPPIPPPTTNARNGSTIINKRRTAITIAL